MRTNMFNKLFFVVLAVISLMLFSHLADAQCAMCRATVESSVQNGGDKSGLNMGIIYLMSIPYVLFSVIGYFWFKSVKKDDGKAKPIGSYRAG